MSLKLRQCKQLQYNTIHTIRVSHFKSDHRNSLHVAVLVDDVNPAKTTARSDIQNMPVILSVCGRVLRADMIDLH